MSTFTPHVIAQRTKVVVVAVLVFALASLCQIIAIVTPGWLCSPNVVIGLFIYCGAFSVESRTDSTGDCKQIQMKETPDSLQAVRVLAVVNTCLIVVSFIGCCAHLWLVVRHEKIHNKIVTVCVSLALIAVILTLVTSIVYGVKTKFQMPIIGLYKYDLYYSYAIFVTGGLLTLLGAVLVVASVKILTRMLLV